MALFSYATSHFLLILMVILGAIVLGCAAFFLKNWKIAAAAIVLVIAGLAYQAADMEGYRRKVNEDAQAEVKALQTRILADNMRASQDALRATADAYLNNRLDVLSRETPYNPSPCLDLAAVSRVRAINSDPNPRAPSAASRLADVLSIRRKAAE